MVPDNKFHKINEFSKKSSSWLSPHEAVFKYKLFTSYILTIFKQRNLLLSIWETAKISYSCMYKYYSKNVFVENVRPANVALFIYVSTHYVETVKWLDYNRYCQLTQWCSGNASGLGARGPWFNPRLRQGFLCLIFCTVNSAYNGSAYKELSFIRNWFSFPDL